MIQKHQPDPKLTPDELKTATIMSPRRHSSSAQSIEELADEQLQHFCIDKNSTYGKALHDTAVRLYEAPSGPPIRAWR